MAEIDPRVEAYGFGCDECACRMMAAGIDAAASKHYQAALNKVFGDEAAQAFERIKVWAKKIAGATP